MQIDRRRCSLTVLAAAILLICFMPSSAPAAPGLPSTREIAKGGFGDARNSYAWSMAWFRGRLYVGTARSEVCVEGATLDFFFPGRGYYGPSPGPGMTCPADKYDLNLRAEIWRYTPSTRKWQRVYVSPNSVPNPRAPGKSIARDIGFRGMTVYAEPGQKRALYIAGVTADEYIPELAKSYPPRILRTTNGTTFKTLRGAPKTLDTAVGKYPAIGYRAMAVHDGRLFVTASGGLTGDGVILEVQRPSGGSPRFVQVSPSNLQVFELREFNRSLYAGVGSQKEGYSVWKTGTGGPPFTFTPVIRGGAARGAALTSVVSMEVYRGSLYVGSSGWYGTLFPASELVRIGADNRWDVVVGNPRIDADGTQRYPASGLPDGFGNSFNAHFWRAQSHDGALYVGTNDWSWAFRGVPGVDPMLRPEFGFDMYGTCDGTYWWPVTRDAFGDGLYNFGARTLASTRAGAFVGSTNHVQGAAVWRSTGRSPCRGPNRPVGAPTSVVRRSASPPRRLLSDLQSCGTVLSWDGVPAAAGYRILRSEQRTVRDVHILRRPALAGGVVPDLPATPVPQGGQSVDVPVPGRSAPIGTTRQRFFVDRGARRGARYSYEVVALGRSGRASGVSNTAIVPSARPRVTFAEADAALRALPATLRRPALRRLAAARRGLDRAQPRRALARLSSLARLSKARSAARPHLSQVADPADVVFRLMRRIEHAQACRR
jgi:hypothetical protein